MKYVLNGKEVEVIITKKNNKNTYIKVKEDLKIYVTTNYLASSKSIIKLLDNNQDAIQKMFDKMCKRKEKQDKFYYLGKKYDIIIMPSIDIDINDNFILVKSEDYLNKWLIKEMKKIFKERLDYCYNLFEEDIPYPKLKFRNMKTRWGVCNKNLSITLNTNLIKYEINIIDYVIIHELSHFIHFDHSKSFWNLVGKYCNNYKDIRKILKE